MNLEYQNLTLNCLVCDSYEQIMISNKYVLHRISVFNTFRLRNESSEVDQLQDYIFGYAEENNEVARVRNSKFVRFKLIHCH